MVRPDEDQAVGVHSLAELLRRDHARDDRDPVGAVLGEDPQGEPLARGVALAGDDDDAVALVARQVLERGGDLAVDGIPEIREEQAEGPGPAGAEASRRRVRDVMEVRGSRLDELAGGPADPGIVRERSRGGRAGDVRAPGDITEQDSIARAVHLLHDVLSAGRWAPGSSGRADPLDAATIDGSRAAARRAPRATQPIATTVASALRGVNDWLSASTLRGP